ncbi:DUF1343 domain-containing protein [candidate division KSB1 bacterium]|nr:DUF1343 domain-containing protein [candidate division KSB1 bacterium]
MMKRLLCLILILFFVSSAIAKEGVLSGLDNLVQSRFKSLDGLSVGLITNPTAVSRRHVHAIDILHKAPNVELVALFAPEHGLRGDEEGGREISSKTDPKTGLPIFSLYGKNKSPSGEMLEDVDALVFDIQDIGTRFYTYISTMFLCMDAAARENKIFIVLDRPNPINGVIVEGPVLDLECQSFVGIQQIALRHGMTVGELALMFNGEEWLESGKVDLRIIEMKNWQRHQVYTETGLPWIKPSPNINTVQSALLYPGMGLLEGTNVSEGRGTLQPFEIMGAPWIDAVLLKGEMENRRFTGISMDTCSYIPASIPGVASRPKYEGQVCKGLLFHIKDMEHLNSVEFGVHLLCAMKQLFPDDFELREQWLCKLLGSKEITAQLSLGRPADEIIAAWQPLLDHFKKQREKVLLYP